VGEARQAGVEPEGGPWFAHLHPSNPEGEPHRLVDHLRSVADLAAEFADPFGGREWAWLAGLWHDLGKFSREFQEYLAAGRDYHAAEDAESESYESSRGSIDHSSAGAQQAIRHWKITGFLPAWAIAGHHAGLLDAISSGACMEHRLAKEVPDCRAGLRLLPEVPGSVQFPRHVLRAFHRGDGPAAFAAAFFVRMIFSCLVDADFLDTEAYMDPDRSASRPSWPPDVLTRMARALDRYVATLPSSGGVVDRERRRVREECLRAAELAPGLFSLTVPTGGGKTLSSLAFALAHALRHGLRRVIYVIPFTSIIEQNADVFRRVVQPLVDEGLDDPVLEHHSAVDAGRETLVSRLAAENWDAPLIVTTAVQFYESLFASRPRRCRKLHNVARSVIILDEVQKLPVSLLRPCLAALRELAEGYGCSIVLCTATQPAVAVRDGFEIGLEGVREIVSDPVSLHERLRRTRVRFLGDVPDDDLTPRLLELEQVLCIVNTRAHAATIYERLRGRPGSFHLSAAMCPVHRAAVLEKIREALGRGEPCRVVSTQLVEAGVDLDFPVVFRSMAGLDSIAQAAGRCNRNGRLPVGNVFVFRSEHPGKERFLRETIDAAIQVLDAAMEDSGGDTDLLDPALVTAWFEQYYWKASSRWDELGVMDSFELCRHDEKMPFGFQFAQVGRRFRVVEAIGRPVIVPWGEQGRELCRRLEFVGEMLPVELARRLQRYTVEVPRRTWERAISRGDVRLLSDRYPVLPALEPFYDREMGLVLDRENFDAGMFVT